MNRMEQSTLWVGALRYYMGRMSAGVSDFCDLLIKNWSNLDDQAQNIIKRDLDRMIKDHAEAVGEYKPLGMECDYKEWLKVQGLWRSAASIDDESPKAWDSVARACERLVINGRPASNFAALIIKNENFWRFMSVKNEESCDRAMKAYLKIASKADLDRDQDAYNRFILMFGEYSVWMQRPEF